MLEWLSDHRAAIALILIIGLIIAFIISINIGLRQTRLRAKDQVFGDPERTKGGWFWAVCGVSALLLVWFYYSWGVARAVFPMSANELCQVAKVEEAMSPIIAVLPVKSRYMKSTTLVVRNGAQIDQLVAEFPENSFSFKEGARVREVLRQTRNLMALLSDTNLIDLKTQNALRDIQVRLGKIGNQLAVDYVGLKPSEAALQQPKWGISEVEIPMLPITAKGVLIDSVTVELQSISKDFLRIRNLPPEAVKIIDLTKAQISTLKKLDGSIAIDEDAIVLRHAYIKAVERIFRRIDDGTIFPAEALNNVYEASIAVYHAIDLAKGSLNLIETVFFPGQGVIKSRTQCTEQGSGRWLPKPTDVIATFVKLANPDLGSGGGYKGTTLLWWKWLPIADVAAFLIPDGLVDLLPGSYGTHDSNADFRLNLKDWLLAFAQGDVYLGVLPMLDGHIWDSLFRVLVAMIFGVLAGVPLGIYMGVSRFFRSFFDPLIELYRPVPPLAWAPLILTIFGIQDDGKIFLLFMVAFAIMVISARTGASSTQLSKIRASHSLGASNGQILRCQKF